MNLKALKNSDRLKSVLRVLADCIPHTGQEIERRTNGIAAHSDISDLRRIGVRVPPALYIGKSIVTSRKIFTYRIRRPLSQRVRNIINA